jgi:hypothetical protein
VSGYAIFGTAGGGGGVGGTPTYVAPDQVYTVSENSQALFSSPIDCEGMMVFDGLLIEVI